MRRVLPLVALLAACSSPTELMLVIKAGPGLVVGQGGDIDQVRVQAQRASDTPGDFFFDRTIDLCTDNGGTDCRPQKYASVDYDGALTLPIHLLLEPGSMGLDEEIRVWVDGLSVGNRKLASGLRFQFSKGRRLWLDLPLYEQCLNMLTCEEEDLACGYDTDCVEYTPTQTDSSGDGGVSPTVDLAGADLTVGDFASIHDLASPAFDLTTVAFDLAAPCGDDGQACCTVPNESPCKSDTGLTCDGTLCTNMQAPCGENGKSCCSGDGGSPYCNSSSLACDDDMNCAPCGAAGSACCGTTCNPGTQCTSGMCEACGEDGMTCCAGNTPCNSTTSACTPSTNKCAPCGENNELCCGGNACATPKSLVCSSSMCVACGGPNEPCCSGGAQGCTTTGYACDPTQTTPMCGQCGEQVCCTDNMGTQTQTYAGPMSLLHDCPLTN